MSAEAENPATPETLSGALPGPGNWWPVADAEAFGVLRELGAQCFAAWLALQRFAMGQRECWPGVDVLAELMGCSPPSAYRALEKLEKAGRLSRRRGGRGKAAVYRLLPDLSEVRDQGQKPIDSESLTSQNRESDLSNLRTEVSLRKDLKEGGGSSPSQGADPRRLAQWDALTPPRWRGRR